MGHRTTSELSSQRLSDPDHSGRPPDIEIQAQVERILKSKIFSDSERLQRFLNWTVEQVLKGEGASIKQFTIGQEVFDRGPEFDPRTDSIVRTEAQRLRRKLSEYYRGEGVSDSILVLFEPGSYIPVLKSREGADSRKRNKRLETVSLPQRRPSTAVLSFLNLTGYADQEYFCRGIAESIQAKLANLPNLKVISTHSAFRFTAEDQDLTRIGRDLGVHTVIEGSVQLVGVRIRIHAKIVDIHSGSYVWARVFDRELTDLFSIQDEIARSIAEALTERPAETGTRMFTLNADAYRMYLRGRHCWNKVTVEGCEQAVCCFLRTITMAPDFAEAYAALADAYHWLIFFGARRPAQLIGLTRRLALQALRLDRNCSEAYIALAAETGVLQWRWNEAELFFRRGLEIRPNYFPGYLQRAFCSMERGNLEASRADLETALDLDPLSPRPHRGAGIRFYLARDFASAIAAYDRALELGPDMENTYYYRGLALLGARRTDEAILAFNDLLRASPSGMRLGALVAAYAGAGRRRKAEDALRQLHERSAKGFASPIPFVHAYAALGQNSKALDWLERALDARCTGLMQLKLSPLYDSLRDEPRFQAVLEEANLA